MLDVDKDFWRLMTRIFLWGRIGGYPPFILHPPKYEKSENLGRGGVYSISERRAFFSVIYPLFIVKKLLQLSEIFSSFVGLPPT